MDFSPALLIGGTALSVGLFLSILVFLFAKFLQDPRLEAKGLEYLQSFFTATLIFASFPLFDWALSELTSALYPSSVSCTYLGISFNEAYLCEALASAHILYTSVVEAYSSELEGAVIEGIRSQASLMSGIGLPTLRNMRLGFPLYPLSVIHYLERSWAVRDLTGYVVASGGLLGFLVALPILSEVVLVLGAVLRAIPPLRKPGGLLLASAFVMRFGFPLLTDFLFSLYHFSSSYLLVGASGDCPASCNLLPALGFNSTHVFRSVRELIDTLNSSTYGLSREEAVEKALAIAYGGEDYLAGTRTIHSCAGGSVEEEYCPEACRFIPYPIWDPVCVNATEKCVDLPEECFTKRSAPESDCPLASLRTFKILVPNRSANASPECHLYCPPVCRVKVKEGGQERFLKVCHELPTGQIQLCPDPSGHTKPCWEVCEEVCEEQDFWVFPSSVMGPCEILCGCEQWRRILDSPLPDWICEDPFCPLACQVNYTAILETPAVKEEAEALLADFLDSLHPACRILFSSILRGLYYPWPGSFCTPSSSPFLPAPERQILESSATSLRGNWTCLLRLAGKVAEFSRVYSPGENESESPWRMPPRCEEAGGNLGGCEGQGPPLTALRIGESIPYCHGDIYSIYLYRGPTKCGPRCEEARALSFLSFVRLRLPDGSTYNLTVAEGDWAPGNESNSTALGFRIGCGGYLASYGFPTMDINISGCLAYIPEDQCPIGARWYVSLPDGRFYSGCKEEVVIEKIHQGLENCFANLTLLYLLSSLDTPVFHTDLLDPGIWPDLPGNPHGQYSVFHDFYMAYLPENSLHEECRWRAPSESQGHCFPSGPSEATVYDTLTQPYLPSGINLTDCFSESVFCHILNESDHPHPLCEGGDTEPSFHIPIFPTWYDRAECEIMEFHDGDIYMSLKSCQQLCGISGGPKLTVPKVSLPEALHNVVELFVPCYVVPLASGLVSIYAVLSLSAFFQGDVNIPGLHRLL